MALGLSNDPADEEGKDDSEVRLPLRRESPCSFPDTIPPLALNDDSDLHVMSIWPAVHDVGAE
ncbi:hypothetical protein LA66_09300 [Aureimonas altamirensis]|uniref:Uncharacterized protein n=1 Tax=Aureimonas altamirensis TaxID=370622 RepID=A0A0B1Q7G9_9HYPH|nr:hypothetical protein LA66_09300 [Aureimonas altamirensis]